MLLHIDFDYFRDPDAALESLLQYFRFRLYPGCIYARVQNWMAVLFGKSLFYYVNIGAFLHPIHFSFCSMSYYLLLCRRLFRLFFLHNERYLYYKQFGNISKLFKISVKSINDHNFLLSILLLSFILLLIFSVLSVTLSTWLFCRLISSLMSLCILITDFIFCDIASSASSSVSYYLSTL